MRTLTPVALALALSASSAAAGAPRIASLNVCTDQLVLELADPSQIAGLSPFARDPSQSFHADKARDIPALSGGAEDILLLRPDLVVASLFDKRATRELLRQNGIGLVEFTLPSTFDEVKAQIRRMGAIAGHGDRAEAIVARLDAAVLRARAATGSRPFRVLALSRRGWVAGPESLTGALLQQLGLANAATELGLRDGGLVSLEKIIALKPDLLLVSERGERAADQGQALLLHPALQRFYPAQKRIFIPERLTVCGGAMLADALELMALELNRVTR